MNAQRARKPAIPPTLVRLERAVAACMVNGYLMDADGKVRQSAACVALEDAWSKHAEWKARQAKQRRVKK